MCSIPPPHTACGIEPQGRSISSCRQMAWTVPSLTSRWRGTGATFPVWDSATGCGCRLGGPPGNRVPTDAAPTRAASRGRKFKGFPNRRGLMARPFPGLLPLIVKDQLECVHEVGFRLCKCFSFREDIRQFFKGGDVSAFRRRLAGGGELEMKRHGTHGKETLADDRWFCQLEFKCFPQKSTRSYFKWHLCSRPRVAHPPPQERGAKPQSPLDKPPPDH